MNGIRDTMKPRLPLLLSKTCKDQCACRQARFLQKITPVFSALLIACLLWLAAPVLAGELEAYPEVGPTPPLALKDLGGKSHTLDDYRGQVVLLNFWATWCPPCLIEMPAMQRLEAAFPDTAFTVLAVNVKESREKAWRFQKMLGVNFSVLLDTTGKAAEDWDVAVYPTSYLIDTTGRIRYMAYGMLDWDSTAIKQVIETLREDNQQPVLTTTSR
jgi:thiol-disulfide isomerase/thioredoxin